MQQIQRAPADAVRGIVGEFARRIQDVTAATAGASTSSEPVNSGVTAPLPVAPKMPAPLGVAASVAVVSPSSDADATADSALIAATPPISLSPALVEDPAHTSVCLALERDSCVTAVAAILQRVRTSHVGVQDDRNIVHQLMSSNPDTFLALCSTASRLNECVRILTESTWSAWLGQWACIYDGRLRGPFPSAAATVEDLKSAVLWRSGFKWEVGGQTLAAPIDVVGSPAYALFDPFLGTGVDSRPATTSRILIGDATFGPRSTFFAEKALVDTGCSFGAALLDRAFYYGLEPDASDKPTMRPVRGFGEQPVMATCGQVSFAPLHVAEAALQSGDARSVCAIRIPPGPNARPYSIVGQPTLAMSKLTLHHGSIPEFSAPDPDAPPLPVPAAAPVPWLAVP